MGRNDTQKMSRYLASDAIYYKMTVIRYKLNQPSVLRGVEYNAHH